MVWDKASQIILVVDGKRQCAWVVDSGVVSHRCGRRTASSQRCEYKSTGLQHLRPHLWHPHCRHQPTTMSQGRRRATAKNSRNNTVVYHYEPAAQASYDATWTTGGEATTDFGSVVGDLGGGGPIVQREAVSNSDWPAQRDVRSWQDAANPRRKWLHSTSSPEYTHRQRGGSGRDRLPASTVIIPDNVQISLPSGELSRHSPAPDSPKMPLPVPYNIERPPPPEAYHNLRPPAATDYPFKYDAHDDETHKLLPEPPAPPNGRVRRKALERIIDKTELKRREATNEAIIRDMEQEAEWRSAWYPPHDPGWR